MLSFKRSCRTQPRKIQHPTIFGWRDIAFLIWYFPWNPHWSKWPKTFLGGVYSIVSEYMEEKSKKFFKTWHPEVYSHCPGNWDLNFNGVSDSIIHCRSRLRNILWLGRKSACASKLVQFWIFYSVSNSYSKLVENNYLVWFEYTDFHILIQGFRCQPPVLANVFMPGAPRSHTVMKYQRTGCSSIWKMTYFL